MNKTTQSLLDGERLAQEIIQAAENERKNQVQNAQFEAKQELAQIKLNYQELFEQIKAQRDREGENLAVYEQEASSDIHSIRQDYENNKDKVGTMILDYIMEVKLDLPKVVVGNFEANMAS